MPDLSRAIAALEGLSQALSPGGQYAAIRASFLISLSSAAADYLDGGDIRETKYGALRAMVESYGATADLASGGSLSPKDLAFFNVEVSAERDYIESLFGDLKVQREKGDKTLPAARLELYARSLDALYFELGARVTAGPGGGGPQVVMGTWQLGETENHCQGVGSCSWLDGQKHRLAWYLLKNYIPGKPGAAQVCGGWACGCRLVGDDGNDIFAF